MQRRFFSQQVTVRRIVETPKLNSENDPLNSDAQNTELPLLRLISHPLVLVLASAVSTVLWMPFGLGYYDFPWDNWIARLSLQSFAIGFPLLAGYSSVKSLRTHSFGVGLVAFVSLIIGTYGCLQMIYWTLFVVWRIDPNHNS